MGAEVFGLYTLGWSLVDLVSKLGLFGLDRGVIRFVSQHRTEGDDAGAHRTLGQALALGLAASLLVTVAFWAAAPWASSVFHHPELASILRVLGLSIPFLVGSTILLAALKAVRIMKFDVYVKSLAEPFALLWAAVVLCALGWTMHGLAFAYLISAVCGLVLSVRFFRRVFSPSRCVSGMRRSPLRSPMVAFCAPLPFHDALGNLMARIDLFVMAMFLPATSVGIYAATCEVAWIMKDIRQAVDPIFAPVASGLIHERKQRRLSTLFCSVSRWILILEMVFLLGAGLWGGAVLSIFGPTFVTGFRCLILLSVACAINGAFGSSELLLTMAGRSGLNLLNTTFLVAVSLGLNLFLIPRYGIEGAALAAVLSTGLINLLRVVEVRVSLGVHPFSRSLLKPVAAFLPALAAGLVLMRLGAPWSFLSALSLPLYFGLLRAFGMEAGDRELLEKLHAKAPFLRHWAAAWDWIGVHLRRVYARLLPFRRSSPDASDSRTNVAAD